MSVIDLTLDDRLGKKILITCNSDDTVGDLKKIVGLRTGVRPAKLRLQLASSVLKDHVTLEDYEVQTGSTLELYYN